MLNAPYNGGTHLPDITVITPVFAEDAEATPGLSSTSPARGHHADIGGITPGSMPPDTHHVEEEGVLIDNVQLVAQGRFLEQEMREILASGRYPSRNVEQNIADLQAQVAACAKGAEELHRMVEHFGLDVVQAYMRHVQDNAEEAVRRVLDVLKDGASSMRWTMAATSRSGSRSTGPARRHHRLHRHEPAAAEQLQRPVGGVQGGGALRLPHAGRRRDSR